MEVEAARAEFEHRWNELRRELAGRLGTLPRRKGWWILTLAGVVGLAVGQSVRRRRSEEREAASRDRLSRRPGDA